MLTEMVRLSYQHRAFYCYVILSVWIFLLVAGMYKYIGIDEKSTLQSKMTSGELTIREFPHSIKPDNKNKRIFRYCNLPNDINGGSEGKINGNVTLSGILVFVRHGDRGPLTHVRNISSVNCAGDWTNNPELDNVYQNYQNFLKNVSIYSRATWAQFLGPFHGFPMLPLGPRDCKLAQLTTLGVGQLLKTGLLLRHAYYAPLNLGNGTSSQKDVLVYSTRYRRTVQSAVALLYGFLESEGLSRITMKESQSFAFCNADCACPAAEKFLKQHTKELADQLKTHPAVSELIKQAASMVFEMQEQAQTTNPNTLKDALLTYVCHGAPLPCVELESQRICVRTEHITGLFAYTEWEVRQQSKSHVRRKYGLLKAYGMLRSIVALILRIVSESRPKVVLFSGHDKTLEYLLTAFGVTPDRDTMPHYASRFIIEVYKLNSRRTDHLASDFYFRVLLNSKDFTQKIPFCRNSNYYSTSYIDYGDDGEKTRESRLCPIEAIIRQLHDDYFTPFNTTNYKDACYGRKRV